MKKIIKNSPIDKTDTNTIQINRFSTPLGPMFICATEIGVCLLEFADRKILETEFNDLQRLFKANIIAGVSNHIKQTEKEGIIKSVVPDKTQKIVVYCANSDCNASPTLGGKLMDLNYNNVRDFDAGLAGWKKANFELTGAQV
tara:strand:+ start:12843 stop:13271 length:429 start_codon:yes stop_codon:yes gene_type:complete